MPSEEELPEDQNLIGMPLRDLERFEQEVEEIRETADEEAEYEQALERAAQEVARRRLAARSPQMGGQGAPFDLSDLGRFAPEGLSPAEVAEFKREAEERGREMATEQIKAQHRERGADDDEANQLTDAENEQIDAFNTGGTPMWIVQRFGAPLTDEQKQRVVDYWNDIHGTWGTIRDFDTDLAPLLENAGANVIGGAPSVAERVIQAAILDEEPIAAIQIELPGRDPMSLTAETVEAAQALYGLDNNGLIRLVRLSAMYADEDERIEEIWQPIAALMAATDRQRALSEMEADRQERMDAASDGIPGDRVPGDEEENRVPYVDPETGITVPGVMVPEEETEPQTVPSYLRGDDIAYAIDPTFVSFGNLRMYWKEGLELYNGSQALAFLHALDRGLAARLAASGGDPGKVSGADNAEAIRLLTKGGLIARGNTPYELIGGYADDSILRYLQGYFDSLHTKEELEAMREGERTRIMPDPVAVEEQVRELWRQLFHAEPSEGLVSAFQQELEAQINQAPMDQNVDVMARIQAFVRGQPIYQELYGNKPEGMSEQEYQEQFYAGARSMLGNEAPDEEAILAGMRSGEYQTTIGAIAGSRAALDNSTFQERLALASRAFREMV